MNEQTVALYNEHFTFVTDVSFWYAIIYNLYTQRIFYSLPFFVFPKGI